MTINQYCYMGKFTAIPPTQGVTGSLLLDSCPKLIRVYAKNNNASIEYFFMNQVLKNNILEGKIISFVMN